MVFSRVLVVAAGAFGVLFDGRVSGWTMFDPTRLTTSFGSVGNALTASLIRWDSLHYLSIAAQGYKPAGDVDFFPFYPVVIHVVGWVVRSNVVAGILVSLVSFVTALVLLHRITSEELGDRVADATVLLLAFAPLSVFFSAVYTESLFLALSVGTFYLARQGRFRWACVTAACASITHVEGLVLCAPVAYMLWEARGRPRRLRSLISWDGAALMLSPATFVGLLTYMHMNGFGWLSPFTGAPPTGHGRTIAPYGPPSKPTPDSLYRTVVGPFVTIWHALDAGAVGLAQTLHGVNPILPGNGETFSIGFQNVVYLVVLLITLTALSSAWRLLPKAYAIYSTLVVLVFTMSVVNLIPLRAFDRYMMPLFPLWMMVAKWLDERRLLRPVLLVSPCLMFFYTVEFSRWVMVG